jgi:hypothetical protein
LKIELNHADGSIASVILYRQGGENSTSSAEALQTSRRSSTRYQVVHPWWLGNGQRLQFIAGREPASILLLFLGGNTWRMPASCDGGTQGLDCLEQNCTWVFSVKWKALSSNYRFLRASNVRAYLQILYLPQSME